MDVASPMCRAGAICAAEAPMTAQNRPCDTAPSARAHSRLAKLSATTAPAFDSARTSIRPTSSGFRGSPPSQKLEASALTAPIHA